MYEESMPYGRLGIIGMRGCEGLIDRVDGYLRKWDIDAGGYGNSLLLNAYCPRFSSGEAKGIIQDSVRGYDLYILSDVFNYGVTYKMYGMDVPMSPDDHYQDLKRIIMATNGKARRITVIMPMLYEGRQHRRFSRESLDCAFTLRELVDMGVENIITFDAHDARVQNAIPLAGFENVMPNYQMIKTMLLEKADLLIDPEHMMVISPDEGGMGRCIYYASVLELELGMFYKRRDYSRIINGRNPIVKHEFLGDNVNGKDVIIIDDMISAGDSVLSISKMLKEMGARRVFVFVTFGLFTDGLERFDSHYESGCIDMIFSTNLIYRKEELLDRPWYCEVDMSKYIAYIVSTLNTDRSISELLNPVKKIEAALAKYRAGEEL